MPTFVMLSTIGPEGMDTLRNRPERVLAVNDEVESMGVRIIAQYALMGEIDFLTVLEAPDEASVMKVAVELGARGTLKTRTLAAMPIEEFVDIIGLPQGD